ncbi:ion channel [Marivivens aquimaris]|uniref:ion channel n=1 Tax=Marivivens aquimaris TaxID=2774876 RepID=UPI001D1694A5|nr:ion channel [Marivivens aquimaris]
MITQILIGSILMVLSIVVAGVTYLLAESMGARLTGWLNRPPFQIKLLTVLSAAALLILLQISVSVWLWAFTMWQMDLFETLERSVYFALTCFTTLGFGDVLLPKEWQLLGGLAATNGMVNFGFAAGMMVETMRLVRRKQVDAKDKSLES